MGLFLLDVRLFLLDLRLFLLDPRLLLFDLRLFFFDLDDSARLIAANSPVALLLLLTLRRGLSEKLESLCGGLALLRPLLG